MPDDRRHRESQVQAGLGGTVRILKRLASNLSEKANQVLDRLDDPGDALDLAYQNEVEQLASVHDAIGRLAASYGRLSTLPGKLATAAASMEVLARDSLRAGRRQLALEAMARRHVIEAGREALVAEAERLAGEEKRLAATALALEAKLSATASRNEALKQGYKATGNRDELERAVAEIRADSTGVRVTARRAEELVRRMTSRAAAIDRLLDSGALADLEVTPAALEAELDEARRSERVDRELRALER